ncbi:hypothetical protein [Pseudomonas fluorescens]|uniref:hypothetical protein n=1 Tax=Pseudomonas fluorescens TaxID=294 RepID=UPI00099A9CE2|nr:hypothetical protein [Pseudomonas fluorescens]OPB21769.1 hypothetical protein BFW90_20580 [Pseudomonas fluorescens]
MEIKIALQEDKTKIGKVDLLKVSDRTKYFQSKLHEIAFYFSVNNAVFDKHLGIKKVHTIDVNKARALRNSYLNLFHPDKNINSEIDLDFTKVSEDINGLFSRVSGGKL